MLDATPGNGRLTHAPANHPSVKQAKIGVLLANLGTPVATDYWSMRRYVNEFLSDKRVIDLPDWKWQPILQLIILSFRPQKSGANYRLIWNEEKKRFTSNKVVSITSKGNTLSGTSFWANENFSYYEITQGTGDISLTDKQGF